MIMSMKNSNDTIGNRTYLVKSLGKIIENAWYV